MSMLNGFLTLIPLALIALSAGLYQRHVTRLRALAAEQEAAARAQAEALAAASPRRVSKTYVNYSC